MEGYITRIVAVRSAARLLNRELYDHYALFGALPRYGGLELDTIVSADGIDDLPEKAESFRFGAMCGEVLNRWLTPSDTGQQLALDAAVARAFLLRCSREQLARYDAAQLQASLELLLRALVKRAQLRTHTAKPGYEDINVWLERYYRLQREYRSYLPELAAAILDPREEEGFLDPGEAVVAAALGRRKASPADLAASAPASTFGRVLCQLLSLSADES